MSNESEMLFLEADKLFFQTYRRLNINIECGNGCYLYDNKGSKILDMFAGLAVNVLGYNNNKILNAIKNQVEKYIHISNLFYQQPQIDFASKLINISGYNKLFLCNSGAEAAETAIKIIRKYFSLNNKQQSVNKREIIAFTGSFHGRTMGALSLTSRPLYREGFKPFLPDVKHLEFNSVKQANESINENTAAVFLEFIQGENGIIPVTKDFVESLFTLRDKFGFLIVADEIQSGVGRTGKFFSFQHFGVKPDAVLLAKGIGGGLPLGAVLGNERVENVFSYGDHGSTFGGNPVSCAAGCVILDELLQGLMETAEEKGEYLIKNLLNLKELYPEIIKDVRGKGLMVGLQFNYDCSNVVQHLLENGILVNCTNKNVIRLLPPLIITKSEIDYFIEKLTLYLKTQ